MVYLATFNHLVDFFMVNVGKYTIQTIHGSYGMSQMRFDMFFLSLDCAKIQDIDEKAGCGH